ncbi:MAG: hypothetical protein J5979_03850 [Lachnospiraceae bacterium]|nr:hypothetical protein [Lachnospiraceae bacterium]
MSAPVDSLSIKVDASARSANQQLDNLVQKMVQLRSTINDINIENLNKMAASIQNFSKAITGLNQVKTSDFTRMAKNIEKLTNVNSSNLDKSAQSVEKAANSLQRASSVSKKAISSGLKFDASGVQDMQKAIQGLSNEFANAGKGKAFEGTLAELEREADRLRKNLDSLSEKEEKILTVGGTSTESKTFKNLQFDISKTLNQLSELEDKIEKVRSAQKQDISSIPIFRYDASVETSGNSGMKDFEEKVKNTLKGIPESAKYSVEDAKKSLTNALNDVHIGSGENSGFRNYTEEIKNLKASLKSLEQSGKGMGSDEWEQVYLKLRKVTLEAKEYKYAMDHPVTEIDEEIKKTDSLGNHIEALKAKLKDLQSKGLNFGDPKFDSTYRELQKSTAELKKYKSSLVDTGNTSKSVASKITDGFRSIWNVTKKAGSGVVSFGANIKNLTTRFHSMSSSTNGLIGKLMKLYIGFQSLRGVGNFLKDSVESSMNYIEEYNYFNTTMEKIASEWSKDYKKYGYENADEYGKSFQGRLTEVMNKMTGFQMNDDGTLTDSQNKNLGLDVTQMTNYAAGIAQVTNSVGMTGEASVVTSKALSMLAGDMSSFRNLDMSTVMNNFSSGLIGQSRALYKYGIDITNATLATYAHEMGIKKDISAMTQNEKMQLRMIAILDQSKVAWGDLAKTINSPSNQLRLLQNNFKALSRTIGNMFLPIVAKVLPYVNGLVIAIRRLFEWTASMLGIKLDDVIGNSGGGYSDMFDGIEEDAGNASDAVDDTTDSVKKLAKQLMGFDELNVITTNQNSGKDKNESGDSAPIDLTSQLSSALADYEKVWNDAYENITSDAEKFANKLTKLFKDAWTSGDGSDIGSAIAKWLNKGLKWVNDNWSVADEKVQKIANILATAVNGFTYEFDWSGLGTALSNTLQTWLDGETTFFDNTDWTALGEGIATSLNSFIGDGKKGPIQSYFKNLGSKLRAAIEFAFGAITTFKFDNLGKAIGQGINDFLDKMGKVNPKTKKNGWQELGETITEGISGIADTLITALDTVHWEDVAQAIADFISSVDMGKIGWKLGKLVSSMATALYTLVSDKETWKKLGTKIGDGINSFFESMGEVNKKTGMTGWQTLGATISNSITGIANSITTALETVKWEDVGQAIADFIKEIKWGKITWDLVNLGNAAFDAICDAVAGITEKAPLETAVVALFAGLKLTGATTAISRAITKLLASKGLTLGQVAISLSLGLAAFKLADSDNVVKNMVLAPIAAFLAAHTFTGNVKVGLKVAIATVAIEGGWNFGKWIGELFTNEDMKEYQYSIKFSDLFSYSPSEWADGFKQWWNENDVLGALKDIVKDLLSGDFHFTIPFTDYELPSVNDIKSSITKLLLKVTVKAISIGIKLVKKGWKTLKGFVFGAIKALSAGIKLAKDGWKSLKNWVGANKTIQTGIELVKKGWRSLKDWLGDLTATLGIKVPKIKITYDAEGLAHKFWQLFGFEGTPKFNISYAANGGIFGPGQLVMTREKGPELVGTYGNKTAVMNNNQIVQSVSDGIFNVMAPVLTQVVNSVNALNSKIDSISGNGVDVEKYTEGDLLKVVRKEDSSYRKRTGKSAFAY